jgi:hypothetical protein
MDERELQERVRRRLGLRVGREMAGYMLERIEPLGAVPGGGPDVDVIGGDARTGEPVRTRFSAEVLRQLLHDAPSRDGQV